MAKVGLKIRPRMEPKKIIVRVPNWIGDHVMALGFYQNLRHAYPKAEITWLVRETIKGLSLPGLCDEIIVLPEFAKRIGAGLWRFSKELITRQFDLSVSLPATLSSSLLFFLSKIPERTGFAADGNEIFYTSYLRWKGRASGKHKSRLYLDLVEYVTNQRPLPSNTVRGLVKSEKKIIVAPGASIVLREWPHFEALTDEILKHFSEYQLIFVGAKESWAWHEILKKKSPSRVTDLIERTSLDELIELCKTASLVIANDSGVAHLGATLSGAKTIVLFGPGDPAYIMPQGNVTSIRRGGLSCSPCEKPICRAPHGYQACLKTLPVVTVLDQVKQALH